MENWMQLNKLKFMEKLLKLNKLNVRINVVEK